MDLKALGWNKDLADEFSEKFDVDNFQVGRVSMEYKGLYKVYTAEIIGRTRYNQQIPAVGD